MQELLPTDEVIYEPEDEEGVAVPKKPQHAINPFKQGLAGITDAFTGIPMMLGGIAATGKALNTWGTDKTGEVSFADETLKELSQSDFFKAGANAREGVNNLLGIEEPVSTVDQASRLLTSAVMPVPGSVLSSVGGKVVAAALPLIRTTTPLLSKGNAIRYGVQEGLNVGVDQGMRALTDQPLIFSDEALGGIELPGLVPQAAAAEVGTPIGPNDQVIFDDRMEQQSDFNPEAADIDRAIENQTSRDSLITTTATIGAIAATLFGLNKFHQIRQQSLTMPSKFDLGQSGTKGVAENTIERVLSAPDVTAEVKKIASEGASELKGDFIDANAHLEKASRALGMSAQQNRQLGGQEVVDSYGRAQQELIDKLTPVLRKIERLSPDDQAILNDGVMAMREDIARVRGTINDVIAKDTGNTLPPIFRTAVEVDDVPMMEGLLVQYRREIAQLRGRSEREAPGLWSSKTGQVINDTELGNSVRALEARPELMQLAKDGAKIADDKLAEAVRRGVLDPGTADTWRKRHTSSRGLLYIPGKENTSRGSFLSRIGETVGIFTSKGKELGGVANWHAQGLVQGEGIRTPLDFLHSISDYVYHVTDHLDRSVAQWNHLSRYAGIDFDAQGNIRLSAHGQSIVASKDPKATRYLGMIDPKKSRDGNFKIEWHNADPVIKRTFKTVEDTVPDNILSSMDNVIWTQKKGKYIGFYVPDGGLKTALEFNQALANNQQRFFNHWKNIFTQFTTGQFSPFAPISFLYQQQVSMINAGIRHGFKEAGLTWADSFKGAWKYASGRISHDWADLLTEQIERNLGLGSVAPRATKVLRDKLQRVAENSLIAPLQRETGRLATSLQASEYSGSITDIMEKSIPHISSKFGANALPQLWRMWQHINTALHEGSAYGIQLRKLEEQGGMAGVRAGTITPNDIRTVARDAKDITGDVRRRGTSQFAQWFNASVPFSGSMLQAWATLGSAIKSNPQRALATLSALVATPTAMEVTWNHIQGDDDLFTDRMGKVWSYQDYYWNGFTTDQRNNNSILFVPGKPPWEAVLIPISPEFSLVRSTMIEGMDAVFGLSKIGNSGETGENGRHFLAALTRVFDIPVPPPLAAAISATFQADFRVGPNFSHVPGEGEGFSLFNAVPYASGQKVTSRYGREKYINSEFDTRTVGVIQDLFGGGATLGVAVWEAFNAGREGSLTTGEAVEFAGLEFGRELQKQARYTQPLFGKAIHPNPNDDIARQVFEKKDALTRAQKELPNLQSGGLMSGTVPAMGNTINPIVDPVYQSVAVSSPTILKSIEAADQAIAKLRNNISTLGNASTEMYEGKRLTPRTRKDLIDSLNLKISEMKAMQLVILKNHEDVLTESLSKQLGRDVNVNFSGLNPRPNPR